MKTKIISSLLVFSMMISFVLVSTGCSSKDDTKALWEAGKEKDKIVVISDIHLGIDDNYTEMVNNRPFLIDFLQHLQKTKDVRELVIAGDFLDEWFLPVYYPSYTDVNQFYKDVIATNQEVFDELNKVIDSGINLVYVPGNHDLTLEAQVLQEAIPKIVQARDAKGLGVYYTGDRNEIAIEHGHRYDVFSAPDTLTNAELAGNDDTILPAGYFYARYAATWVLEGRPSVEKILPEVTVVPDQSDTDQFGAYIYYSILRDISQRMTPNEGLDEKIFDMRMAGFNDAYTYLDFYPVQQPDGTISAPVLFKNIQRTWADRQILNNVKNPNSFIEAVAGTLDWEYFKRQADTQYLSNPGENIDVVVFGHTHIPSYANMGNGKFYVNEGTWIDHNTDYPDYTRTFAVITTGQKTSAALYRFEEDCSITDITIPVSKANVKYDYKTLEGYGDENAQASYVQVSGMADDNIQSKLNEELKNFCLEPTLAADKDTLYNIAPVFEVVADELLSIRTYNTAYTAGAPYPVNSIQSQIFSLTTGEKNAVGLWDFIKDKEQFKQMVLDGKFYVEFAGVEGEVPEELKVAAYNKLATEIDNEAFASQFFFSDGGRLSVWCQGESHATGDYWVFDIPVVDLEEIASDQLLPIIETLKSLGN